MASTKNKMKNTGMRTLFTFSMPPPMPKAMTSSVTTMAAACQAVLPQAEAVAEK